MSPDEPTGDCYEAAGSYVSDMVLSDKAEGLTLVHGVVSGQGPLEGQRLDHAWIEVDEIVIDRAQGRNLILPRVLYYLLGRIDTTESQRYAPEEVMELIQRHEHWGPWCCPIVNTTDEGRDDEER